jgi:hypothetical protein
MSGVLKLFREGRFKGVRVFFSCSPIKVGLTRLLSMVVFFLRERFPAVFFSFSECNAAASIPPDNVTFEIRLSGGMLSAIDEVVPGEKR